MISLAVDSWLDFALQNVALSLGMIWLEWSFTKPAAAGIERARESEWACVDLGVSGVILGLSQAFT